VTLGMVCPFEPAEKQALLEATTPDDRARALLALLQIEAHAIGHDTADPAAGRLRVS
jgi:Lon protease-like protein